MASVLVVDDHPLFLSFLEHALSRHGHRAVTANSGAQGLALLDAEAPDVAVIDVIMPEMDGIELLRALRERRPDLVVIAMTGAGDGLQHPVTSLMYALGARAVIAKPFSAATLIELIDGWKRS